MPEPTPPVFTFESGRRLSDSVLWRIQRAYYERQQIHAWTEGKVPSYITTNPFVARAYARVVLGFLRDCLAAGRIDPAQPLYIVEAGAGSGRFGYHFLTTFAEILRQSSLKNVRVKFVMTDFHDGNLEYWSAHPRLAPFFESGLLDIARFDAEHDSEITLRRGGETLSPESLLNPLVVFANYVFDTIPQDVFYINEQGVLHESLLTLESSQEEPDINDPALLRRARMSFEIRKAVPPYYPDPSWNRILDRYSATVAPTSIVFPSGGLSLIARLRHLSGDRLLLLTCDKGQHLEQDLPNRQNPNLALHDGAFSIHVNYHAMGMYFVDCGGVALHTENHSEAIDVSAFGLLPGVDLVETRLAYLEAVNSFGPDDFFTMKKAIEVSRAKLTLPHFLALLRLSNYDARVLDSFLPAVMPLVVGAAPELQRDLALAMKKIWDIYFPIADQPDIPFSLGMVLTGLQECEEALVYFQHSLEMYGPAAATVYHMGICYFALANIAESARHIDWALQLDPNLESARNFRGVIEARVLEATETMRIEGNE